MSNAAPVRVLCIGGSTRPGSGSESAAKFCARAAAAAGAQVELILSRELIFPIYDTESSQRDRLAQRFVAAVRRADALIIASPGYHGSMSGMIKNALDHLEDTSNDERAYLDGIPVGCVAVARGWQASVSTLQSLRVVAHALRGWPSPLGAIVNVALSDVFDSAGHCTDDSTRFQLETVATQVVEFAAVRKAGGAESAS